MTPFGHEAKYKFSIINDIIGRLLVQGKEVKKILAHPEALEDIVGNNYKNHPIYLGDNSQTIHTTEYFQSILGNIPVEITYNIEGLTFVF